MKAFKVFWKDRISPASEPYLGEAIVIAENITQALEIAGSYGEVSTICQERALINSCRSSITGMYNTEPVLVFEAKVVTHGA